MWPGHADLVVLKHFRDSPDTYEDILQMVEENWNAQRSSIMPKASQDDEDEKIDIACALHLGMTTAVPEFRAEKIAYRDGYKRPGKDGVHVDKDYFNRLGLLESLEPAFETDTAVPYAKKLLARVN